MDTARNRLLLIGSLTCLIAGAALVALGGALAMSRQSALHARQAASAAAMSGRPAKAPAPAPVFEPYNVRPSAWAQREEQLFSRVLAGAGCQVLVVPFEARGASVDRPGRSLMARLLAARIATQSGACVVDPTLAARALGAARRGYDWPAIAALADAAGANMVVRGEVALNHPADSFNVQLKQWRRRPNGQGWDESPLPVVAPIAFHDELPPEEAFAPRVPGVVAALDLPAAPPGGAAAPKGPKAAVPDIPADPRALATGDGPPVERAQRLQLLAALLSPAQEAAEHLWERSLVALAQSDGGDEPVAVLRARAFFHLHRRPYAVKLLEGRQSPEARALRAVLDGNPADAQARAAALDPPREALVATLAVEGLGAHYSGGEGRREQAALRAELLTRHTRYAPLLMPALSRANEKQEHVHLLIAQDLKRDGALDAPGEAALRRALRAKPEDDLDELAVLAGLQVESSHDPTWEKNAAKWRTARAFDRLAPWDHIDALHAMNRAVVTQTALPLPYLRDSPAVRARLIARVPKVFTDYPPMVTQVLTVERELWAPSAEGKPYPESSLANRAREVYAWTGGETHVAEVMDDLLPDGPKRFYQDEPMRAWRAAERNREDRFDITRMDPRRAASHAAHYLRAARYTHHQFQYLERAHDALSVAGRKPEAIRLVEENRERFIGNYLRDRFLASRARLAGDTAAEGALLAAAVRARPDVWSNFWELAFAQLRQRTPQAAQQTLLSFPEFRGQAYLSLEVGESACDGAIMLQQAGEPALARPLFETCARSYKESYWHWFAQMHLALARSDYRQALSLSNYLSSDEGFREDLVTTAMLHFLLGEADAGWKVVSDMAQVLNNAEPLAAAFVGHRIQGSSDEQLLQYATQWTRPGDSQMVALLREHFLFNVMMIDRPPSADALRIALTFQGQSGDRAMPLVANAYHAFRTNDHAAVLQHFTPVHASLRNITARQKRSMNYALPYMAVSLLEMGRAAEARLLVKGEQERGDSGFHVLIAQAFVDGWIGDAAKARESLWQAFLERPAVLDLPIPPDYQILEAAELLFAKTKDAAYRDLLIDLARRATRAWPDSWAFAMLAKHTQNPDERLRALGIALFLDHRSEHLAEFSASARAEATKWFSLNNPFSGTRDRIKAAMLVPWLRGQEQPRTVAGAAARADRAVQGG